MWCRLSLNQTAKLGGFVIAKIIWQQVLQHHVANIWKKEWSVRISTQRNVAFC